MAMKIKVTATGAAVSIGLLASGTIVPAIIVALLVGVYAKIA
jgi:hypothetical protein